MNDKKNRTKWTELKEWIDAVNSDARFGRWESDVSFRPSDIRKKHLTILAYTVNPLKHLRRNSLGTIKTKRNGCFVGLKDWNRNHSQGSHGEPTLTDCGSSESALSGSGMK